MFIDWINGVSPNTLLALQGLCSAEPPPGAGGGAPPAGPPPGGFSQEQMDLLDTKFGAMVNAAITSRDKRFEKQLGDKFDALMEKLNTAPKKPVEGDPEEESNKGKGSKDIMLASIQRQLEEMRQRAEAADQVAKQERAKNRDIERRRVMAESLQAIGVTDPTRQRHAIAYLDSEQRVAYRDEESEELTWRDNTGSALDFGVGLRSWARTEDAKHFMNPSGNRGSGSNPGQRGAGPNGQLTPEQILARLDDAIRNSV